jgi:ABC-type branched-subunit amino acid transport system ATPase component
VTTDSTDASSEPKKMTAEEIKADLERQRAELTATVGELSYKVNPKRQVEAAKAGAAANGLKDSAAQFADDVRSGDRKALSIAGAVAAVAGLFVVAAVRGRKNS